MVSIKHIARNIFAKNMPHTLVTSLHNKYSSQKRLPLF